MKRLALGLTGFCVLGLFYAGCDDGETTAPPAATCAPTDPNCPAVGVPSDCVALVDNSGLDKFVLRLSQLTITAPAALSTPFMQGIVGDGVTINLPTCNISGDGTFSFMFEFDKTTDRVRAGGALPEEHPGDGYCLVYDAAHNIAPAETDANLQPDGSFSTSPFEQLTVPVYLDLAASQAVYLPLRQTRVVNAQISADQNCIGYFNIDDLMPTDNCLAAPSAGIYYFIDGGELEGHITLEEADSVIVDVTDAALCVLLSGDPTTYGDGASPEHCTRDGNDEIILEGDWCSATDSAGGCTDAFRLTATIAASAAALRSDCPSSSSGTGGGSAGSGGQGGNAGGAGGAGG